ncbi:glycosyltransferase [Zhouia spongiae]|uniref:Glycosyltransferase n=1 Tax=Zhouia spongiae TaxID=2202721 RepID=A0ABY3YJ63_9FLAO|nr:glycosyltransferase [Zhouia spongiae]UNY97889.1 glycosyltransferase [Zhouia spongiae]
MTTVSIITPTYNSLEYINETIESIINQTYENWELLITDDCSADGTWELLKEYAEKDSRIKIFQLEFNSGPGVARNNSIQNASGRFISFCDSDDVWKPNKLEDQIKFLSDNDLPFTYSSYQKMDENGNLGGIINVPEKLSFNDLLKTCPIGCLTAIYDTEKIGKVYMPIIRKRQDYGLWLKIFKEIRETRGMQEVLAYYRVRTNSVSSNKLRAAKYHFKVLRTVAKVPFIKACYYFVLYAFSGLFKYLK